MRAAFRLLTVCTAGVAMIAMAVPAANAGYPFKCPKNTVLVLRHNDATATPIVASSINDGVIRAVGFPAADTNADNPDPASNAGDTVIVCDGTYTENVNVPLSDVNGPNSNITIRSFDDATNPTIVGNAAGDAVFDILAPGVLLGGTHLGFEITGTSPVGIQVGVPGAPDLSQDDDQEQAECVTAAPDDCPDEELAPFATSNVAVVGNEIRNLGNGTTNVTGISVNNTSNTLLFRNKVDNLDVGTGRTAIGIRYSDTNYNNDVISNAVKDLSQTGGGTCGTLTVPTVGAIGVSIQGEALDAMVDRNLIENIASSCTAIGVYSNAWGGLENTRNGQQVPIVTDIIDNRIKKTVGAAGNNSAAIALAPLHPANTSDDNDPDNAPSSFRVLANDLDDHTGIAVAVLSGMAPNSWIRENDLDHDQIGVYNASGFNVDATNNWWGCAEGPRIGANTKADCSSIVNVTNVNASTTSYTPWLKSHAAHAGSHAGEYAGH